jgi:hypothetical protein
MISAPAAGANIYVHYSTCFFIYMYNQSFCKKINLCVKMFALYKFCKWMEQKVMEIFLINESNIWRELSV